MDVTSHKDFYKQKHAESNVEFLINRKLLIHKQLETPSRTYAVYTDLHGSYEKLLQWLKNGMGYTRIAVSGILGNDYSAEIYALYERLLLIVQGDRVSAVQAYVDGELEEFDHRLYFFAQVPSRFVDTLEALESKNLTSKRILKDLMNLLRAITRGDEHRIFKAIPLTYQENMLKLYFQKDTATYEALLDGVADNRKIYHMFSAILVKLIIVNMLEKHVNLGDTLDRGDGADKLIAFYRAYFDAEVFSPPLHYIWGNHDLLWLGASVGNPILCVTALRISLRYNNMDFLYRYGFSVDKLKQFALNCYHLTPTGAYTKSGMTTSGYSLDDAKKMAKVLLVLETKLTLQWLREALTIAGEIDYLPHEARFSSLLNLMPTGIAEDEEAWADFMANNPLYSDVYFPTIDSKHPERLTDDEQELVDDLVRQFTTLPRFQDHMKWLFWKGEMYRVVDNTLYYHAALPATNDMGLAEIKGMKGKGLLDWLQRDLKRIGDKQEAGKDPTCREKMLLWFLWCGAESPFFCKSKMATLERAVFNKEEAAGDPLTTWKEDRDRYYEYIRDDRFLNQILREFHADKLVMGHTPVKTAQQGRLSDALMAFCIDGGASPAYGDRGAVLIHTPDWVYLTFHPSLEELMQAEEEQRLPDVKIMPLEEPGKGLLRDMEKGYFLRQELEAINELLEHRIDAVYGNFFRDGEG